MITDFNMPGMDGIELAIAAKNMQPAIQIIMISADLSPDIIETAANADISKIVSEPVNVMKLFAIIRSAFRLR